MASSKQIPELKCLEQENYKQYFRALCWSGTRKQEKKSQKKIGKREKQRRLKAANNAAVCHSPALLSNPSQFAVFAAARSTVLSRWRHLLISTAEVSDESDNEDSTALAPSAKIPKITGIGLRAVFALISQSRFTDANLCDHALKALMDVLQGHAPEELAQEPTEIISNLHAMLVEVASGTSSSGRVDTPSNLTALSSACLIALSVARGEAELILNAVATLIMSTPVFSEQPVKIPKNLTTLQRSVLSVVLGPPARNQWLHYGVPHQALVTSFPVDLPSTLTGAGELVVRSLVSDGCFVLVFTSKGLLKIGSGYGSSIRQHVYSYKPDFFAGDRHGWLGYCKNKLYVRIGRKKNEIYEVDKETLELRKMVRLEIGEPAPVEPKTAIFSDGNQIGLILVTNYDSLTIRMYDISSAPARAEGTAPITLASCKEINVHLLRRKTLAFGRAPFEDMMSRRPVDIDAPVAMQLDDNDGDPLVSICGGLEFGLLTTAAGKVYYTGKGTSLGYKTAIPQTGRWTIMKENTITRNDMPHIKKCKIFQVAVGHEGVHAIFVLDNGTALFAGVARRGEDGDSNKHRRTPKPSRPKKIYKAEGHQIVYAACNNGSTALVTRQGMLLMFGKDTQYCDSTGTVLGLRHERVIQVALGKAHAVVLTNFGEVYTFGINNKGQCGREFGFSKEKTYPSSRESSTSRDELSVCQSPHVWVMDYCRVCELCRECTGFSGACHCSHLPNRVPGEKCGCGEGDSGCTVCGICRRCAEALASMPGGSNTDLEDESDHFGQPDSKSEKEGTSSTQYEGQASGSDADRDPSIKVSCLPPARVAIPGGHRIVALACGLHHTILLTEHGEVITFGSNQYGQLGAGDIATHHRLVKVRVPRAFSVAAGSYHSVLLTRDGEVYTFGSYQKGSLGRPRVEEPDRGDKTPIWYATPGRVPRLGGRHTCRAVWVTACGDQTFVQVSLSLIQTETLFSSTITANHNCIMILPNRPEHSFKCITISKNDGSCNTWPGPEQVDFVNTLACLDPLYDVLWCYQPQMRVIKCYNIGVYESHKVHKCCNIDSEVYPSENDTEYPNYGNMKRLEDFKNLENFDMSCNNEEKPVDNVALINTTVLNQELAIPTTFGFTITRMHAALHLLGCLDSLAYAHCTKLGHVERKREYTASPVVPIKEDFLTVNRFESNGGGWGYSGHSVEAIRFMCDADVILGGFGIFGGRGDYTVKIKLYDIGMEGGEQESDGDLIAESDEVLFECAPRDRFPVLFDVPVPLAANRWYVAWACLNGPSSDCGSSGQAMVIHDEVGFHFKTSKKSNNGTDVNAGQIPSLYYNVSGPDRAISIRIIDLGEPIIVLSKGFSRSVTVQCFKILITLLKWSWSTFKGILLDTNGQVPINYHKLSVMKHQKRLVYVIRACLRLVKFYVNEIYPQNNRKRNSHEYMSYFEAIAEVRNLILAIMADATPNCLMLPRRPGKNKQQRTCYVTFALELTNSIIQEAHDNITSCYHAFFPTPTLKWNHLCSLLYHVRDGAVLPSRIRELTSTCASMCASKSLRDVLQYVVPLTESCIVTHDNRRPESKVFKDGSSKSATVPRSSQVQKPPPVPPRTNTRDALKSGNSQEMVVSNTEWHLLDAVPKLLDIILIPVKQQMMTRHRGQPHDHGEIKQRERLAEFCCKLITRIIAELSHSATNIREVMDLNTVKHLVTPSRFMRVNQTRAWNTGNGSPDAICFTVDRGGISLVGVCVYAGPGEHEYSLELLHDVRLRAKPDETNPSHCWVSLEIVHGTYNAADCVHDVVQLKFDTPVSLKEELRYAIRLCNHGGRSAHGDCGLPSVKGPDGTTFRFAFCSLSFNGTTVARGQISSLIYYNTARSSSHNSAECTDALMQSLRGMTMRVAGAVVERSAELLCTLRNDLTTEDLRRNAAVLHHTPAVTILLPYTLAHLEALKDTKSAIQLLEVINKVLPHVAALNQLLPPPDETTPTVTHHYTWIESAHPYKQATTTSMRVLFPRSVAWTVLEMDPRSITAQPEDTLTVYAVAGAPKHRCRCSNIETKLSDPPFRKRIVHLSESSEAEENGEEGDVDAFCMHYNCSYISVTPKLANVANDWPQKALVVPGNEVVFSLETSSDYLNEYSNGNNQENRFGFRCLCVGYEDPSTTVQRQGLLALEMELVYAGAACASRLLTPTLDLPPVSFSSVMEVQLQAVLGGVPSGADGEVVAQENEVLFLSRGLELSSPPSIHHVVDGQPLLRGVSAERQFLCDFISGAESTAGGRLARWLSPTPRVEPSKCELKGPPGPVQPAVRLILPIIIRDQYGDSVISPALTVEVVVQRLEDSGSRQGRLLGFDNNADEAPDMNYHPTTRENMSFHAITFMRAFQDYSFEELRLASGAWGDVGASCGVAARVPAERLAVCERPDGSYIATWMPRAPGFYLLRCTFDDVPGTQEVIIEVAESSPASSGESGPEAGGSVSPQAKLYRYSGRHSAGLRVRASPSLQAEEIGSVPPGSNIAYVEEVSNKDGAWVRLNADSVRAYADGSTGVAWCLQHHRHLDRVLLVPVEPTTPPQAEPGAWGGASEAQDDTHSWSNDDGLDFDLTVLEEKFPFTVPGNVDDEREARSSPFVFSAEPSKRGRIMRNEAVSPFPKRGQRRSNGNSDDWWSPVRQRRLGDDGQDVEMTLETEIEEDPQSAMEPRTSSRLAQAATQTSPEGFPDDDFDNHGSTSKDAKLSPKGMGRERTLGKLRFARSGSPPPLPARAAPEPPPPPPRKLALSPIQAECLRIVFAAVLWHEGIVHDAITSATFLKFHPDLPKHGAVVVTRDASSVSQRKPQRHSTVEVSNSGQCVDIPPATVETLTRAGDEPSTSRSRRSEIDAIIKEEESQLHISQTDASPSVVNVLPPALRALVALWDALSDSHQFTFAPEKTQKDSVENDEDSRAQGCIRKKRDWKCTAFGKTPYLVRCELCGGGNVPPPLAAHMRHAHVGCHTATSRGFDCAGDYKRVDPLPVPADDAVAVCGQMAQAGQMWYMFCEKCHDKVMRGMSTEKQQRAKSVSEPNEATSAKLDHHVIKDNALFLLDLAPLNNSESVKDSPWYEGTSRSPPTPPGSVWQPAPPFQCLTALGAAPKDNAGHATARYHSLGRPSAATPSPSNTASSEENASTHSPRVHRSVSMGQADGKEFANAARRRPLAPKITDDTSDNLSGKGSLLLVQPSAALQRLVGCGDWAGVSVLETPRIDTEALMRSPVLTFVLSRRDLLEYRQLLDAAVRINTIRQYAFEALNWLLRSATQPTCVHDVMWWFCSALDKFARIVPPPRPLEENKENVVNENNRLVPPTASATAICPGGRTGRGARAAFHAFMGSVSALAPSLPPSSAVALQAVRCWALRFSHHDRAFLHRSQVFSVISKILSHSEDAAYEKEMPAAFNESFTSNMNRDTYVWKCPDVSGWWDLTVSSRQGMAGTLTDGSTETFWESGEEDRNKTKWMQLDYAGTPVSNLEPHIVCVHIDNTRDTVNKILLVSFLYSNGSSEWFHMQDIEVDPKVATWVSYTLPRVPCPGGRVRCELRGPEPTVRVRQVCVLAAPVAVPPPARANTSAKLLSALTELDTLRVFRLLTSQVFGKLLEWEQNENDSNDGVAVAEEVAAVDDSDLREHVVGILFAGHKLTSLQKQVMSHIVYAIGCEAARVREDWETALMCGETAEREADDDLSLSLPHHQDNYCFEMLSLLLALSGSAVGRAHLAQRTELLADLLALLHTGSERVQRQVISLLRRMIAEVTPQKMLVALNSGYDQDTDVTLLEHLLSYVGKAITVQVKVKGASADVPSSVKMGSSVAPPRPSAWFLRGETINKHAHLVAKLLSDMAMDKVCEAWGLETRTALAQFASAVAQVSEGERRPARCLASPTLWMALAALCVCDQEHLHIVNGEEEGPDALNRQSGAEARALCTNHDDDSTVAVIDCRSCGALCAECDRFLHLNRASRTHHRQICKEEEGTIRIDIHEGCGRAKLFWLLLLVDRRTLKGLVEFRGMENGVCERAEGGAPGPSGQPGVCRFCGTRSNTGLLAIGNVCADQQCQEYGRDACTRILPCGHVCGGVLEERECLPCLFGCVSGAEAAPLRQDADDMCMICFTDPLQASPAIQLKCGHVFHLHCCKKALNTKWSSPRITFSFSQCPICKEDMNHWTLEDILLPIRQLYEEVKRKATMRLEYEGMAASTSARGAQPDPVTYAMERYAYYVCFKCGKAYFGGLARCEVEASGSWDPTELVCGACSDVAGARSCSKHGADFLEYKCRYCCSVAVFFCFGTSHFCNACHDDFQRVTNIPRHLLPQCPAGPKCEQLPGTAEECPLHVIHPPTGEEFALGCGVCRNAHVF